MAGTGASVADATRDVPLPGQARLPAASVAALLRRNATDPDLRHRPAVKFGDDTCGDTAWTHAELATEARHWAAWLRANRPGDGRPFHVGVLMENTPTYVAALCGAALAGATLVGLNDTRRGDALARDIEHTDIGLLVVQADLAGLVAPVLDAIALPRGQVFTTRRHARDPSAPGVGSDADALIAATDPADPGADQDPDVDSTWCLVLTSGTTTAPKAIICSQRRMLTTGERMRLMLGVTPDDVGYVSMPLFHSNSLMIGLMPALVAGASVGLARKFTASGWLADVRRHGATWFNYTGKPLTYLVATPEQPDDADNPVRRAFGNEGSPDVLQRFAARFDVEVIDLFGPTEGGVGLVPSVGTPTGALGAAGEHLKVVADDGSQKSRAVLDANGRLTNAEECVGEIVNTAGPGPFEGYYRDEAAYARATRNGWYWTGDLGYIDGDGWLWYAGRTSDWLRVDGENFPAGPIERIVNRHPDIVVAAVYGVPDADAGDRVMAAVVLRDDAPPFDPSAFLQWLDDQPDLGPKWRPTYVRVAQDVPRTATNKILVRELQQQKFRTDLTEDPIWVLDRGADAYRPFTAADTDTTRKSFEAAGRERFWEL